MDARNSDNVYYSLHIEQDVQAVSTGSILDCVNDNAEFSLHFLKTNKQTNKLRGL
jgi:hypothetical protein